MTQPRVDAMAGHHPDDHDGLPMVPRTRPGDQPQSAGRRTPVGRNANVDGSGGRRGARGADRGSERAGPGGRPADAWAAALEAEVEAYLTAQREEVDQAGRRLVVRHGYARLRQVTTVAGAAEVHAPGLDNRRVEPVAGSSVSQILVCETADFACDQGGLGSWRR